jgi:hypothetical protein
VESPISITPYPIHLDVDFTMFVILRPVTAGIPYPPALPNSPPHLTRKYRSFTQQDRACRRRAGDGELGRGWCQRTNSGCTRYRESYLHLALLQRSLNSFKHNNLLPPLFIPRRRYLISQFSNLSLAYLDEPANFLHQQP